MDVAGGWWARLADQRVVDAAVVVTCLALTCFAVMGQWSRLPAAVIVGAGAVGSLAQWQRRQRPQLATLAGSAALALSGNPGPWLAGLYAGAAYAPRRHVWALAVVGWAGFAGWSWIDAGRLSARDAGQDAVAAALVTALGVYVATRRALTASWRERAERAEAERRLRDQQARSAERARIAREMHDVLAHKVSLIALHAGALEEFSAGGGESGRPDPIRQGAALIRITAREALQELRYVLGVLRADPEDLLTLDDASLDAQDGREPFADLASLVQASAQAGQRVELHDLAGPLPPAMARVVHRIVQEGLTNAHKHAPDAPTTVSVDRGEDGTVTVTVRNGPTDGAPADLPGSGSGLVGLAERVRLVGGTLHSGPLSAEDGGGWRLRAVLPWLDHSIDERVEELRTLGEARTEARTQDAP